MSVALIGSFPLGTINVALNGAVGLITPVLAQFDLMLTGSFGLGALQADLSAQLNAALSTQASLGLAISNPFSSLFAQLQALLQVQAGIQAALALGIPAISLTITANISAAAAISATLALKVGGLQALIKLALSLKLPLVNFLGALQLGAGPFVLLSVGFAGTDTLSSSGTEYNALAQAGVGGIAPGDPVFGVVILTKDPSAALALSATLKTS